jgi:hypothetical protein
MKLTRKTIQREPSIRKVEVKRFSLTSSNAFDQVVAALNQAIGHPDIKEFWESAHRAKSATELEAIVQKSVGNAGLMLFVEFDHGAIVRKETGHEGPRILRFVIGNPLIIKRWRDVCPMPVPTPPLRSSSMNVRTASTSPMTAWRVF